MNKTPQLVVLLIAASAPGYAAVIDHHCDASLGVFVGNTPGTTPSTHSVPCNLSVGISASGVIGAIRTEPEGGFSGGIHTTYTPTFNESASGFSFDLSNRVVLVTGASSGIGKQLAKSLSANGAKLVLAARRAAMLEEVRAEIEAAGGVATAVAMDVADEASTIAAFDAAEAAFGPVDSVIANAGMAVGGSVLGLPIDDFDKMMAVNVRGVFLTAREGARRMLAAGAVERGHGRIVLISSILARAIVSGQVTYSASKAAVVQMGRTMAHDFAGKGINVNVICPGFIRTDLNDQYLDGPKGQEMIRGFVRERLMNIGALDPSVLYLCSDASAEVTGSVFTIDDGQSL